jgi:hypothetical protein
MPAHLQDDYRQREHDGDPQPAGHIREFAAVMIASGYFRLERHAADRA